MRFLLVILFSTFSVSIFAQVFPQLNYPKNFFSNPLEVPIDLSGNFGELRPNHYHMGLDLKTKQRENLRVLAAGDGYVARIKIEPAGFGRAIYIDHPNGYTTVYAHLNQFNPKLEAWVKEQQYLLKQWNIFIDVPPEMFSVKKGDFIAYSGNTGGSQAPHLHFEIRETATDINLNPYLFGLPIPDQTRPTILRLASYDRTKSVYEQVPRYIPIKAAGAGSYTSITPVTRVSSPKVSFAITAYDTHSGSSNLNGIYETIMYVDEKPIVGFRMNNISYNDTRYLNAHIDYKLKSGGGPYVQHLSDLPGYVNSIYSQSAGDGVIDISDGKVHKIRVEVKDPYNNTSNLNYQIQYSPVAQAVVAAIPNSKMFYPLMLDGFETPDCEFYIGEKCLYDSVHIRYSKAAAVSPASSAIHTIGANYIPLQDSFLVRIKPTEVLTPEQLSRSVIQRVGGGRIDVQKADWQDGWAAARFRDFGSFRIIADNTAPQIVPVGFANNSNLSKASRIVFTVSDNLGRCKNVRAELDGEWLRFTNDKGRSFIYVFDEKCSTGEHELKITVEDEAGNSTTRSYNFTR